MKNIKRLLGLILTMVLLIGCLPISVFAQETASGTCGDNLSWTLVDGVLTITGEGSIPNYESDEYVPWYLYRNDISSLIIENKVTSIGNYAFYFCNNLDSVSISNHIEHIGHRTFALCSSITNISLPNSIDTIDDFAFSGCSQLESIIIPSSVVTLGYGAFGNCSSLKEITFEGNSPIINLSDPLLFGDVTATVYYPANNPTWTEEVMQDYGGDITWVAYNEEHTHEYGTDHKCECGAIGGICGENLVWTLDEEGTLTISGTGDIEEQPWSAYGSSIKSLIIEEGATGIGVSIFANSTNLDNVVLPNSIIYIDVSAFHSCVKLNSISIPASVTAIDPDAFAGCDNLTGIWVEKDNTKYCNP